jgi:hypothetical protein
VASAAEGSLRGSDAAGAVPGANMEPAGSAVERTPPPTRLVDAAVTRSAPPTRLAQVPEAAADAVPATRIGELSPPAWASSPLTRVASAGAGLVAPPTRIGALEPTASAPPRTAARVLRDWRAYAAVAALIVAVSLIGLALRYAIGARGPGAEPDTLAVAAAPSDVTEVAEPPAPAPTQASSAPGFRLPEIAGPAESEPPSRSVEKTPAEKAPPAATRVAAPPAARSPSPTTGPTQPGEAERSAPPAEPARAESSAPAPEQVAGALEPFATAVRTNGTATVRRLYAAGGDEDVRVLQQVLDLMKEGSLEIEPETPASVPEASGGRARMEVDATARWRTAFGGNRRRAIRLAIELERAGAGWQLASVRILGPGLK